MSQRTRGAIWKALALSATLAALLLTAGPAGARNSTGMKIYNLSGDDMKLVNVIWDGEPEIPVVAPRPGSVLEPGGPDQGVELLYNFSFKSSVELNYRSLRSPKDTVSIRLSDRDRDLTCYTGGQVRCTVNKGNDTATILDPPGTVHNIPAGQSQAQADVLKSLCGRDNSAKCDFTPTAKKPEPVLGNSEIVPDPIVNCSATGSISEDITWEHAVSASNSFGLELGAGAKFAAFGAEVETKITTKYGYENKQENTFKRTLKRDITGHHIAWVDHAAPLLRFTGDLKVDLGNTTWNLQRVYFDYPDQTKAGVWRNFNEPLDPAELKSVCKRPSGLVEPSPSLVKTIIGRITKDGDLLHAL